ncbi:MAG: M1 family metallopeptidase, partial [Saprospiraceae bacterium]|nr:M1 family metallopeptidase [Saprospiraceae bacterium]
MKKLILVLLTLWIYLPILLAQSGYWQQKVDYRMQVHLDVKSNLFTGRQTLFYFNNSPDTLTKIYYHLYLNAFQPGSMMDVRSLNLPDPDSRVLDRISKLKPDEIGYLKILELKQDGVEVHQNAEGTILVVDLDQPLYPQNATMLEMNFEGQVPLQIRRTGRDNAEDIRYSMAQWYPKLCEYDEDGWHADPYVAREFYGVWGNYDVQITLDQAYTVAASGILLNPEEIGHGYTEEKVKHKRNDELTWHFVAQNVHDFVWAADPDYTHTQAKAEDGTILHFFYKETDRNRDAWKALPSIMVKAWSNITKRFGPYPYGKYSFIQGGDGGMEYPMATLITGGGRSVGSLVGVSIHELMHSWYQMMLATNESLYAWMDEGFTTFASTEVMNELRKDHT